MTGMIKIKIHGLVPYIWLVHLKFELANQDSGGRKNFTVLTFMYVNRKGIAVEQLSSLKTALNIHEKKFIIFSRFDDKITKYVVITPNSNTFSD